MDVTNFPRPKHARLDNNRKLAVKLTTMEIGNNSPQPLKITGESQWKKFKTLR
jgi:hypothetical protein